MTKLLLVGLIITVLWLKTSDAVKCYTQNCEKHGDGWGCSEDKDGNIEESPHGCREDVTSDNGKILWYTRGSGADGKKEGCVKEKNYYETETCYCFKDLCNTKYKYTNGAKKIEISSP